MGLGFGFGFGFGGSGRGSFLVGKAGGLVGLFFFFVTKGAFGSLFQGSRSAMAQINPEIQESRSTRVSLYPKRKSDFGTYAMRISYTIAIRDTNYFSLVDSKSFSEENPVTYEEQKQFNSMGDVSWIRVLADGCLRGVLWFGSSCEGSA